ncbi:hypothetical protein AMTRI_Chr03g51410 [Amborella trichopoda]
MDSSKNWYSDENGVYKSTFSPVDLPKDPFLDATSFLLSHKHHGTTALIDSSTGFSISYTQLPHMVKSIASGLHEIGVSQGQVVLMLLPNMAYFPVIFLSIISAGAIATPMNPLSTFNEIMKQIKYCNVVLAFTVSEYLGKLEKAGIPVVLVREHEEKSSHFVRGKEEKISCSGSSKVVSFDWVLSCDPIHATRPRINQNDIAVLLNSSGTSGPSKVVAITHRNLISTVELFVRFEASLCENEYMGWETVYLDVIPMFHIYGLVLLASGLLSLGSKIVIMHKFDEREMARCISGYGVTHIPAVPSLVVSLTKIGKMDNYSFRSLKQVVSGAAPLSKKSIDEFLKVFPHVELGQGYGMTETTAVGFRGTTNAKVKKYSSVGLLAPNMEAKVVDSAQGSCLPPGETGELWLRGPGIMKEYFNSHTATLSTIDKEGWLHTGDIVYFDKDGYLYIVDRLKDIIKCNGFQVAPADLDAILILHPQILDAAVAGIPNEQTGEIPVAFVKRSIGSNLSEADVIDFVAAQVAPYKKVRKVVFVNSIPRSTAGKVLRKKLRVSCVSKY